MGNCSVRRTRTAHRADAHSVRPTLKEGDLEQGYKSRRKQRSPAPRRDKGQKGSLSEGAGAERLRELFRKNLCYANIFASVYRILAQARFPCARAPHLRIPALGRKGEAARAITVANSAPPRKTKCRAFGEHWVFLPLTRFLFVSSKRNL